MQINTAQLLFYDNITCSGLRGIGHSAPPPETFHRESMLTKRHGKNVKERKMQMQKKRRKIGKWKEENEKLN